MTKKPIRVGFDLDGVILYNPARIVRPITKFIKKQVLHQKNVTAFYIPKTKLERAIWHIFHYSSIFVAPGFDQIRKLTKAGVIEPYLVTARYSFLERDLRVWLQRLQIDSFFKGVYFNELDEQPHLYKERVIKNLKLDFFVEDNYDIVRHLEHSIPTKIIWIYNIFDKQLTSKVKVPNLSQAVSYIKPQKNVLIYSEFYTPHWTGIVKACEQMAQDILSRGHSVSVATTQFDPHLKTKEIIKGATIFRFPYLFKLSRTFYSPSTLWQSLSNLLAADTVIINSPHSNILPLSLMCTILGKRFTIFHQGDLTLPRKTGNQLLNRCMEKVFDLMTTPSMALADTRSTYTLDYARHSRVMRQFMTNRVAYIPQFQLGKDNTMPGSTSAIRKKILALKKNTPLIGIAGRFVEEKGFDVLIEAIPHILQHLPTAKILFAGELNIPYEAVDPALMSTLRRLEGEGTFVPLGLLNRTDLLHFYKNIDCFVLSSRSDCFAITQVEAALTGTPVISTNIPGARELVRQTGFGEIVSPEDPAALAEGVVKVLRHNEEYQKYKNRIPAFLEEFSALPF